MMPRSEGMDYSALNWVKKELDETIRQARLALEAFVENPSDASQLQFCVTHLHQARGTLHMVEVDGAALLAEELEVLGRALIDGEIERKDEAYEVLMRGILQLPDYLDHVQAGHPDIPVVLLPLLNDLRALRGESLLSENALFTPDLTVPVPPPRERESFARDSGELRRLLRRLRHDLQLGLLGWYRGRDPRAGLDRILAVIEHLDQLTQLEPVRRLWWISAGLVEALRDEALEASVSVKLLLGQVDRRLKQLIDGGEAVLAADLAPDLLRNMLYYVARAAGGGERVNALKTAFDLERLLPGEAFGAGAALGPGVDSLRAVAEAVKEDLAAVKDGLDLYVRSEPRNPAGLAPLPDILRRAADTFGMLSLGAQRRLAQEQAERIAAIAEGDSDPDEETFTAIAGAILEIEASLDQMAAGGAVSAVGVPGGDAAGATEAAPAAEETAPAVNPGRVSDSEFRLLVLAMAREAAENMARIKEAVVAWLGAPAAGASGLDEVPRWLAEVKGSFQILNLPRAAQAVQALTDYVGTSLAGRTEAPPSGEQDTLADVIAGIEYYLEAVVEHRADREAILDRVDADLGRLGSSPDEPSGGPGGGEPVADGGVDAAGPDVFPLSAPAAETAPPEVDAGPHLGERAASGDASDPHGYAPAEAEDRDTPTDAAVLSPAPADPGLEVAAEVQAEPGAGEGPEAGAVELAPVLAEDGDPEILAIFLEEAEEELGSLRTQVPRWVQDREDREALGTIRRSFHTLKGSGRLSGALRVGEFAWALESLLNRVLEGEGADAAAVGVVGEAVELLPGLIEELRGGEGCDAAAVAALMGRAQALARGEDAGAAAPVAETAQPEPKPEVDALAEPEPAAETGAEAGPGLEVAAEVQAEAEPAAETGGPEPEAGEGPEAGAVELAPVLAEDGDPEILAIFLEEAEEELGSLRTQVPRWVQDREDREALGTIRRSFHTLKGSGRLSGALRVGEFAWALESLLNRVLEGEGADAAAVGVVGEAVELLPGLIEELRGGEGCDAAAVAALMGRAQALARGEDAGAAAPVAKTAQPEPEAAAEAQPAAEPAAEFEADPVAGEAEEARTRTESESESPDASAEAGPAGRFADPVLYETFSQEVQDHLATVEAFVESCDEADGSCHVTEELVRAFHTLHGSAYMAGVPEIAGVAEALERLLRLPAAAEAGGAQGLVPLIAEGAATVRAQLAALAAPGGEAPDAGPLLERIARLAEEHRARGGRWPEPFAAQRPAVEPAGDAAPPPANSEAAPARAAPAPEPEPEPEPASVPAAGTGDELAGELVEIFLEEAEELLDAADDILQAWERHPEEVRRVTELQRALHTLKGGARMADIAAIADLSHAMESLLSAVVDGHVEASWDLFQTLHATVDQLHAMQESVRAGAAPEPAPDLVADLEAARSGRSAPVSGEAAAPDPATEPAPLGTEADAAPAAPAGVAVAAEVETDLEDPALDAQTAADLSQTPARAAMRVERRSAPRVQSENVRVRADLLDNLVNYAGEVSIYRSRMEQQTAAIRFNLVEFDQTVERLREQLRRLEIETEAQILYRHEVEVEARADFDPLELDRYSQVQQLSRGLAESVNDLVSIQGLLDHLARESETLLLQQSRVNTDLQEGLMRTRMVPFAGLVPRLRRIVRQTCTTLGKRAELKVQGAEGEMDRTVLDRLVAPLEHMLRNAISHGIETPEVRRAAGKAEAGTVLLSLGREGSEVVIRVSDDGAGIDLDAIRAKAIERGLLAADAEVSDHDVMQFILESGFSTARTLTQISGRGVGMDVVNSEIKQLGGQLEIDSRAGRGMTFTVRLPFTLAVTQALLVNVSDEVYAIPLSSVEGIVRLGYDEISRCLGDEDPAVDYAGQRYRLIHMGALLGLAAPPVQADRKVPVLLVRSGDHQSAVLVDGLVGSREIVVKSVGPQLSTVRGISGATILGDGRVVLIVDAGTLLRLSAAVHGAAPAEEEPEPEAESSGRVTVMVVDDSITVRKVTTRLLERHDMDVITAKDGVDAVALLQEHIPDVMLLDIEMPRMDGFELATHMRNEERLRDIPIIMITSRTGEKHREHAMRIGVNRYLGKPYQEGELLENIHALLDERAGHGGR